MEKKKLEIWFEEIDIPKIQKKTIQCGPCSDCACDCACACACDCDCDCACHCSYCDCDCACACYPT